MNPDPNSDDNGHATAVIGFLFSIVILAAIITAVAVILDLLSYFNILK